MPDSLYLLSDKTVFLLVILITVFTSVLFIALNKAFKLYKLSFRDNTAIASMSSLIGIIYGVLVGLLCLYLLNNADHAANAALDEAAAAANIYRESKWLREPLKNTMQTDLRKYIRGVIVDEWPTMQIGQAVRIENSVIINTMSELLVNYPIRSLSDSIVINNLNQDINALAKARHERIAMSKVQLQPGIWLVILLSTFLIILINFAFRIRFKLHLFSLTVSSIMAASILFLLITLDRPFQGEFIVGPDAMRSVLELIEFNPK